MTNESESGQTEPAVPPPEAQTESTPVVPAVESAAPTPKKKRSLAWLGYVGAAVVPAVIVAVVLFFVLGGDDGDSAGAGLIDAAFRIGTSSESDIITYDALPPGFPEDLPVYPDAAFSIAFFAPSLEATGGVFVVFYSTSDSSIEVVSFYEEQLDEEPWQVEGARRGEDTGIVGFNRPDNIDVTGTISVRKSKVDDATSIVVIFSDLAAVGAEILPDQEFILPQGQALPTGFPDDVVIYAGATITDAAFQRTTTSQDFLVTFLTRDSQDKVIEFYREEFEGRGWTVTDAPVETTSFALAIDFTDSQDQLQGQITADQFAGDKNYTQVRLLVSVDPQRGRGN